MLLALDTSTPLVTVALADAGAVLDCTTTERSMQHGELLASMIAAALARIDAVRQDLSAVVVGVGPGPYTGLRVGVVTARMLGLSLRIPVHGVCSLDILAAGAVDAGVGQPFLATLDARRKELFWAAYDAAGRRTDGPSVDRPLDLPAGRLVVGAGPVLYPHELPLAAIPVGPDAATLARAVAEERVELVDPEPIYLRRPDATAPGPRKRVS